MQKKATLLIIITMILFSGFLAFGSYNASAEAINPVIIFSAEKGDRIAIVAHLKENYGISDMLLTLDYDSTAFKLTDIRKGSALDSLDLLTTADYDITPYKLHYFSSSSVNDNSTGVLLTMYFDLREQTADGDYYFGFKCAKNSEAFRVNNGSIQAVNPLIDRIKVTVENSNADKVSVLDPNNNLKSETTLTKDNTLAIVLGSVIPSVVIIAVVVAVVAVKRKNKSKRI